MVGALLFALPCRELGAVPCPGFIEGVPLESWRVPVASGNRRPGAAAQMTLCKLSMHKQRLAWIHTLNAVHKQNGLYKRH